MPFLLTTKKTAGAYVFWFKWLAVMLFTSGVLVGFVWIKQVAGNQLDRLLNLWQSFFFASSNGLVQDGQFVAIFLVKIWVALFFCGLFWLGLLGMLGLIAAYGLSVGLTAGFAIQYLGLEGWKFLLVTVVPYQLVMAPALILAVLCGIRFLVEKSQAVRSKGSPVLRCLAGHATVGICFFIAYLIQIKWLPLTLTMLS